MFPQYQQPQKQELKFVCISDTHNYHPKYLERGDVLIHCGDFTRKGGFEEIQYFNQWLDNMKGFKYKIIIAGNHDLCFDSKFQQHFNDNNTQEQIKYLKNNFIYLENSEVEIEGYKIWGSPHSLKYWNGSFQITPNQAQNIWNRININADIVLTHGPPYGHGDFADSEVNKHVGDKDLLQRIKQIKPKYHIFGHIHEGYGQSQEDGITFIVQISSHQLYQLFIPQKRLFSWKQANYIYTSTKEQQNRQIQFLITLIQIYLIQIFITQFNTYLPLQYN